MSGSVENMVQDMLKDELGLMHDGNNQTYKEKQNISNHTTSDTTNFIPLDTNTNIVQNTTTDNNSSAPVANNGQTDTSKQQDPVDETVNNVPQQSQDGPSLPVDKNQATETDIVSIIEGFENADVNLRELLGDEDILFEKPFTEMEINKFIKQKLKKKKTDPDRLRTLLQKRLEDSDTRKLIRLKWRVRGLARKLQIMDGTANKKRETSSRYPRRSLPSFKVTQSEKDRDPDYRVKSNQTGRKLRESEDYVKAIRERENLARRKRRQLQKFREKDNERRRQRRQDQNYRKKENMKERLTRKKRMENEEYRQWTRERDNASRRRRRQDAAYRRMESERDSRVAKISKTGEFSKPSTSTRDNNETMDCIEEDPEAADLPQRNSGKRRRDTKIRQQKEQGSDEQSEDSFEEDQNEDVTSTSGPTLEEEFTEIIQPPNNN